MDGGGSRIDHHGNVIWNVQLLRCLSELLRRKIREHTIEHLGDNRSLAGSSDILYCAALNDTDDVPGAAGCCAHRRPHVLVGIHVFVDLKRNVAAVHYPGTDDGHGLGIDVYPLDRHNDAILPQKKGAGAGNNHGRVQLGRRVLANRREKHDHQDWVPLGKPCDRVSLPSDDAVQCSVHQAENQTPKKTAWGKYPKGEILRPAGLAVPSPQCGVVCVHVILVSGPVLHRPFLYQVKCVDKSPGIQCCHSQRLCHFLQNHSWIPS